MKLLIVKLTTYYYYKVGSMYDVEVVSSKAEVLSVEDIDK